VSESQQAEIQHWQARTDDLSTANERLREDRDECKLEIAQLQSHIAILQEELKLALVMVGRLRLHLQQGVEL